MSLSLYFFQLEICNRCVLCSALVCTLQLHLSNASSSLYTISEHRSSLSNGGLLTHIHVEDLLCMTFRVYENFGAEEVQDISNRQKYSILLAQSSSKNLNLQLKGISTKLCYRDREMLWRYSYHVNAYRVH
ncbi:hypothetical protein BD769DRAFT_1085581 [Suillus cothurnatus]|nr:hypothetical protein BD769DRAFT_1085581 [Suillus cothurnatus]